jgi:hypothetical protein
LARNGLPGHVPLQTRHRNKPLTLDTIRFSLKSVRGDDAWWFGFVFQREPAPLGFRFADGFVDMTAELPHGIGSDTFNFAALGVDNGRCVTAIGIEPVIDPEKNDGFSHLSGLRRTIVLRIFVQPAEVRVHGLHLSRVCVKSFNREMYFRAKETFTNCAGTQHVVVLRFFVPDDFLDCLLAACATGDVNVEVAPGTYGCATVSFGLADVIRALPDPAPESFNATHNIVPGEAS